MVKLNLSIKAVLTNVTDLQPADDEGFDYHFKIKCNSCQEVTDNLVTVCRQESSSISGSRGEANLVMRCKFCKREGSLSFEGITQPYPIEKSGQFAPIVTVECRGLEPVDFEPMDGWKVKGAESNTVFDEVDLSDDMWADYDEKAGDEVSVAEFECKFTKA
ncbi:hypothetical protein IWQ60_001799 [Tieghemiomyces parasiticus]|uniref:DUF866-domain-containing protein n=1 Tax=Tieghemiomyces parasiticus TaxID=78921 RepID=A0A9W8ACE2_9FUNG|nr:hypothetical protein IWQ60_001799 [Tieghemiomyces parasiticus]